MEFFFLRYGISISELNYKSPIFYVTKKLLTNVRSQCRISIQFGDPASMSRSVKEGRLMVRNGRQ
jgi:hypothetical protein